MPATEPRYALKNTHTTEAAIRRALHRCDACYTVDVWEEDAGAIIVRYAQVGRQRRPEIRAAGQVRALEDAAIQCRAERLVVEAGRDDAGEPFLRLPVR